MEILDVQIHPLAFEARFGQPALMSENAAAALGEEHATVAAAACAISAMDAVGVDGAVVVSLTPDLQALANVIAYYPDRLRGVLALHPPPLDRDADELIAEIRATPGLVGLRLIPGHPSDEKQIELYRSGAFEPIFTAAEQQGLALFLLMFGYLPELHTALRTHPDLTFVIDHSGLPIPPVNTPGPELFEKFPEVLELAQFPNVVVKLSALPALSVEGYPFDDVWKYGRQLVDAFGPDRLMWGSDYTRVVRLHNYREAVDFIAITDQVTDEERAKIAGGTLRRVLKWPKEETAS